MWAQAHDDRLINAARAKMEGTAATGLSRCTLAAGEPALRQTATSTRHTQNREERERMNDA